MCNVNVFVQLKVFISNGHRLLTIMLVVFIQQLWKCNMGSFIFWMNQRIFESEYFPIERILYEKSAWRMHTCANSAKSSKCVNNKTCLDMSYQNAHNDRHTLEYCVFSGLLVQYNEWWHGICHVAVLPTIVKMPCSWKADGFSSVLELLVFWGTRWA